MADRGERALLDVEGAAAPPRQNGELVFASPWESRLFGITLALHERGLFDWEEFREELIAEIARWEHEASGGASAAWCYYERWQTALERLLAAKGLCGAAELDARAGELAARPADHDH